MPLQKLNETAAGVFIISATPFTEQGDLDLNSTDRLIEFYLEKGVSGMTILGMMGEAQKLTVDESSIFLSHVIKRVADRIPVVVGVSNPELDELHRVAEIGMDAGAAGVMVAPKTGLPTDEEIYEYYSSVFTKLGENIPVVYQDYPFVTQSPISVYCFNRLVRDFKQLVMLKHEEWPGLNKLSQVRETAQTSRLRRVSVLVGNGGLYLPQELARGADGAMTGFAFPEMLVNVVKLFKEGRHDDAENLFDAYLPLVRHEQQPGFGLALRKETLKRRGAIQSATVRQPGPTLNAIDHQELTRLISRVENQVKKYT